MNTDQRRAHPYRSSFPSLPPEAIESAEVLQLK
jgi:hypothetical protein